MTQYRQTGCTLTNVQMNSLQRYSCQSTMLLGRKKRVLSVRLVKIQEVNGVFCHVGYILQRFIDLAKIIEFDSHIYWLLEVRSVFTVRYHNDDYHDNQLYHTNIIIAWKLNQNQIYGAMLVLCQITSANKIIWHANEINTLLLGKVRTLINIGTLWIGLTYFQLLKDS